MTEILQIVGVGVGCGGLVGLAGLYLYSQSTAAHSPSVVPEAAKGDAP